MSSAMMKLFLTAEAVLTSWTDVLAKIYMDASSSFTVFRWITALIVIAHVVGLLATRTRMNGLCGSVLNVVMRAPAVLLADLWLRGWADRTSLYGSVADAIERAGWWNENWPGNLLAHLKYLAIAVAFCMVIVHDDDLPLIYKFFFNRLPLIQMIYIFSQQSIFRPGQTDESLVEVVVFCGAYRLCELMLSYRLTNPNAVSDLIENFTNNVNWALHESELPEGFANLLSSFINTTLANLTCVNCNLMSNFLFLIPFFATSALYYAGLPIWLVQWCNGALCRVMALNLLMVVLLYISFSVYTMCIGRYNSSPVASLTLSWLTLYCINFIYQMTLTVSTDFKPDLVNVTLVSLDESVRSPVAFAGFSLAVSCLCVGIQRATTWYAGMANENANYAGVHLFQAGYLLSYGLDMYFFSQLSAGNSLIGALTIILSLSSGVIVWCFQPLIVSGVWPRGSSVTAVLFFCLVLSISSIVTTFLVLSHFGLTHLCSQVILITLLSSTRTVTFVASYVISMYFRLLRRTTENARRREEYMRSLETFMTHANWALACSMIWYYIIVFLSVDSSCGALIRALMVAMIYIGKPYVDRQVADRLRVSAQRLVSSFPAPNLDNGHLADRDCPICLVKLAPQNGDCCITPCGHSFHRHCMAEWLQVRATCPFCNRSFGNQPNGVADDILLDFADQLHVANQLVNLIYVGVITPQQAFQIWWQRLNEENN